MKGGGKTAPEMAPVSAGRESETSWSNGVRYRNRTVTPLPAT